MFELFPKLWVGDSNDAYWELFVLREPGENRVSSVLDTTLGSPSIKWKRAKQLTLKRVGFAQDEAMPLAKLLKAIDFIQKQRSKNQSVMVCSKNGLNRAPLVCMAYLITEKGWTWDVAETQVKGHNQNALSCESIVESVKKLIEEKFAPVV